MISNASFLKCTEHNVAVNMRKRIITYEFWLVTSGKWTCDYKKEQLPCDTGCLLLFHPGSAPSFITHEENALCYCLQIEKNFFENYCTRYDNEQKKLLSSPFLSVNLPNSQLGYLTYLIRKLRAPESTQLASTAKHFLSNALFAFFADGWDSFGDTYTVFSFDLIRRMDLFLDLSVDVTEIYDYYPVSPTSLIKEFKQASGGYTIVQYRHKKRMEYAAQLLTKEGLSITETANTLNYASTSYFSELFRKFHGMTPRQYQLEYRNKQHNKGTDE